MPLTHLSQAWERWRRSWGVNRELEARVAYLAGRCDELADALEPPEPEALAELGDRLSLIRLDLAARRTKDAALSLNELDERVATLESLMAEAASERAAQADRVERLRRKIATCRGLLGGLQLVGIGRDGLAMLEARLMRAERNTSGAAIASSEAETAAVERALERLAERTGHKLTHS
jgi:chromosome segregation ATPase